MQDEEDLEDGVEDVVLPEEEAVLVVVLSVEDVEEDEDSVVDVVHLVEVDSVEAEEEVEVEVDLVEEVEEEDLGGDVEDLGDHKLAKKNYGTSTFFLYCACFLLFGRRYAVRGLYYLFLALLRGMRGMRGVCGG